MSGYSNNLLKRRVDRVETAAALAHHTPFMFQFNDNTPPRVLDEAMRHFVQLYGRHDEVSEGPPFTPIASADDRNQRQ